MEGQNEISHYESLKKQDTANRKLIKKLQLDKQVLKEQLILSGVVKLLPQYKYCNVCNLPTDGEKCYSKRCPV